LFLKLLKIKQAAYEFINFMLDPKNAAQNAKYVGYATPNIKAQKLLPKEIKKISNFIQSNKQ
jgi:spermidine/putrescine transport system substrate-binding protein